MLFSSHIFIFVFLPLTLAGFCLFARFLGPKPAKNWLTVASLVFYGWWNPTYVVLIVASMLVNFSLGRRIGTAVRAGGSGKAWLVFGLIANLLLLGYFKYANFFVDNVNAVFGAGWNLERILLPLGISFFTFTQIAYLVDVRRGVVCEYDLGDFLLFITFFPHLIAGPILHHREMMPQFREAKTYRFDWNNIAVGLAIFAAGLFKKTVIADPLSEDVGAVFGAGAALTPMCARDAWAGMLCFAFQMYFDFSGYSDMAIGLARMFGIVLPINFNSPYKAVNITEFWRRWHMTLTRFLRDYIFIPLNKTRLGKSRRYVNLVLTMVIAGFWHGAAWTFVLWGLFQGVCLVVNHRWGRFWQKRRRPALLPAWLTPWIGRSITFGVVVTGGVLFRSTDLHGAWRMLETMFGFGTAQAAAQPFLVDASVWRWLACLLAAVWLLPNTIEIFSPYQPYPEVVRADPTQSRWYHWRMGIGWACVFAVVLGVAILAISRSSEFLYYNF